MNRQQAEARFQGAVENWKYVCEPGYDGQIQTLQDAARWLYCWAGNARRFGITLSEEVTRILADRGTIEKALEYFEIDQGSCFFDEVRAFMLATTDDVVVISVDLESGCLCKESKKERIEFAQRILDDEARLLIFKRDWHECATREIGRYLPDDAALLRRLGSIGVMLARTDWIMRAGIGRFTVHAALMDSVQQGFIDGAVTQVHEWWFFDLRAFERGELLMEEITYGCTDPIRFPEWKIADYLGGPDSEEERAAVEAHLAKCECCRTSVEHAKSVEQ